ncbi:hypothetical protein B7993_14115 [Fibrobacter sp. UWH3]|nr:hypothetical protein B7993_14115 [Fibrobacter sp. UWH3]SHL42741.1 hypothetical protein SAMN05720765_114108 [Fibrobacter sp. UWH6]
MKIYLSSLRKIKVCMKKIIYAMTFAGICAVGANAAITPKKPSVDVKDGCYQISTAAELYGFAAVVNGTSGQTANKTACGKLTANITVNSSVHESTGDGWLVKTQGNLIYYKYEGGVINTTVDRESWTPIQGFAGKFDGGTYSISGLYLWITSNAGFFESISGGAVIKNLNIRDSYFRVEPENAGGLAVRVEKGNGKLIRIDNSSFGGTVAGGYYKNRTTKNGANIGGLIGTVKDGARLVISNSINHGRVFSSYTDRAGLSKVMDEETLTGTNIAGLIANVESGAVASVANCYNIGTVDANSGSSGLNATVGSAAGTLETDNVNCESGTTGCTKGKDSTNLTSSFNSYDQSNVFAYYDPETVESIIGADSHPGVTISEDGLTLTATIHDDATTFSIPQDIKVDTVVFTRQFTAGGYSTITLPFSIESSKINEGANTFAKLKEVTEEDGVFTDAVGESTTSLEAYTPYLLTINSAELLVSGAVTLKKNPESATTTVDDWSFIGTMAKKRWQDDDKKQENADELGSVYGFAGSANKNNLVIGSFVKAGNKVAILPLRAYLIYNGSEPEKKPAAPGAEYAPAAVASIDKLPESMRVIIVDPAPADTDEDDNQITAIKNLKAPANIVKSDRWHDVTGRSMNKPKAQGAYVNYRTPVIVK